MDKQQLLKLAESLKLKGTGDLSRLTKKELIELIVQKASTAEDMTELEKNQILNLELENKTVQQAEALKQLESDLQHQHEEFKRREYEAKLQFELQLAQSKVHEIQASSDKYRIKLDKLTDEGNPAVFFQAFEKVALIRAIPSQCWGELVVEFLTGKALESFAKLGLGQAKDYQEIKRAVLLRFDISAESHRRQFRQATKRETETYREFGVRLEDSGMRWLTAVNAMDDARRMFEAILLEQYLNCAPMELKIWLLDRNVTSVQEASKLADTYIQIRNDSRKEECGKDDALTEVKSNTSKGPMGSGQNGRPCGHCGKTNHEEARCFKLVGYPNRFIGAVHRRPYASRFTNRFRNNFSNGYGTQYNPSHGTSDQGMSVQNYQQASTSEGTNLYGAQNCGSDWSEGGYPEKN